MDNHSGVKKSNKPVRFLKVIYPSVAKLNKPDRLIFFVAKERKLHKLKSTVTENEMACIISDFRYIQELSGHNSSKTTEIYTHITQKGIDKIISPFDHIRKK